MSATTRDYFFIESTTSLCPICLKRLDGKIVQKGDKIYLIRHCFEHGEQIDILEEDAEYFHQKHLYNKPGSMSKTQTDRKNNCPFDCGLCPEHEQHTCIGLIEVTSQCNLGCPVCFSESGEGEHLPLEKIEQMVDLFLESEYGHAEILQISGGEPTGHPRIIDIIKMVKKKNIKYVLLNTNGMRIAEDEKFTKELATLTGGFEIYFQFDGFDKTTNLRLRGQDLLKVKLKALNRLMENKVPVSLVSVVEKGINDHELGKIIDYGIKAKYIRGVNFQPLAFFGRLAEKKRENRLTISGVLNKIETQTNRMIRKKDFIPLPCDVHRVAITYLYRQNDAFIPLTRNLNIKDYLPVIRNTFKFDPEDFLRDLSKIGTNDHCCDYLELVKKLRKLIPAKYFFKTEEEKVEFVSSNTFRISISSFVDAYNFDMSSIKKECVHVITPDLKKIPFSAYNILYRKGLNHG